VPQAKNRTIVAGAALLSALGRTAGQIRWLRPGDVEPVMISPAMAIPIVRAGDFEGRSNHGHIVLIRERRDLRRFECDLAFWNHRGVRRFVGDQCSRPHRYYTCEQGHLCWGRPKKNRRTGSWICQCPPVQPKGAT
jgi:hypothetical protein